MKPIKPKIDESEKIWNRAKSIIPAGCQTFSKGPTQFVNGVAPKYLKRGEGSIVWDVDDNRYIDYIMGCHPIVLGYNDPDVNKAIENQIKNGITFSLMNPLEVDVTEQLIDIIPCAEGARFGKNGADVTSAAVRIARAVTDRDHIAYCGYHGWHDWYIANTDLNSGIPKFNQELSHSFSYNDLDSLEKIFKDYPDQIAVVIMEPLTVIEPENNFLKNVKDMAHQYGALLVFDEIITGFRFSLGGAQELVGVTPDLACFAKGMSNGMPLSAIVGNKDYIFSLEKTFFSFTYGGECLSLAAAKECINKYKREPVIEHLWEKGKLLKDGFNSLAKKYNFLEWAECKGYPCRSIVSFDGHGRYDSLEMKSLFQQELLKRGVLWAAYHAISYSHNDSEIDHTLNAFDDSLKILSTCVQNNKSILSLLEGKPVEQVFRKVADFNSYTVKNNN